MPDIHLPEDTARLPVPPVVASEFGATLDQVAAMPAHHLIRVADAAEAAPVDAPEEASPGRELAMIPAGSPPESDAVGAFASAVLLANLRLADLALRSVTAASRLQRRIARQMLEAMMAMTPTHSLGLPDESVPDAASSALAQA